jgi:hypothetical protein
MEHKKTKTETEQPGFRTQEPRVMVDLCLCGHGRPEHVGGYQGCLLCTKRRPVGVFTCRPGTCDRFTWNPAAERK